MTVYSVERLKPEMLAAALRMVAENPTNDDIKKRVCITAATEIDILRRVVKQAADYLDHNGLPVEAASIRKNL